MSKSQTFTAGCSAIGGFGYAKNFTLYVILTDRDGNTGNNTSQVDYKVYCQSNGSGAINAKHYKYFSINGQEKINTTESVNVSSPYAYIPIASGTISVAHNSDGTKTIPFSAQIKASNYGVSASVSGNFTLETINRYAHFSKSWVYATGLNTVDVLYRPDRSISAAEYSLNGGAWGPLPVISGNWNSPNNDIIYRVSGLKPNTAYNIKTRIQNAGALWTESPLMTFTTKDIARITEAPNINIGSSHTIKWNNPSNASLSLKLCKTDGTTVIDYGTVTGTSKTITPTATKIYALTPNSNSITLRYIITTHGSSNYTAYKDCKFSVTNSNPTFNNFTYKDTNSKTTALTGNNQTIIKGYSNVQGVISVANKAVAKNSATMTKYRLSIGEKTQDEVYSSSEEKTVTINSVQSNTFTMYAIDSRNNSTGKTITASKYINYSPIKITSMNLIRTNSITSETTLNFSGYIWDGNFGSVSNAIVTCYYRYKKTTSSTWTKGETTITPTKNGTNFSYSGKIKGDLGAEGFDINNSYNIQVIVTDKLTGNSGNPASFTLGPGTPAIAIYKNRIAVGKRYDTNIGGPFQVAGSSYLENSSGEVACYAKRTDTGVEVFVGVGGGGINHGVYSRKLGKWLLYADGSNVFLDGFDINRFAREESTLADFNVWDNLSTIKSYADSSKNLPPTLAKWGTVLTLKGTSYNYIQQLAIGNFNSSGTRVAVRSIVNGTATSWEYLQLNPKVLYNNSSGTTGTITLSESAANFSCLEIFFNAYGHQSIKVYNPNGKNALLQGVTYADTKYDLWKTVTISGTSITRASEYRIADYGNILNTAQNTNQVFIHRVVGYR